MPSPIEFGPHAEANGLAQELAQRIETNLSHWSVRRVFRRLQGTIVLVGKTDPTAGEPSLPPGPKTTLTLRFDLGHLVIYQGRVGRPDVTLWGTEAEILNLGGARPLTGWRTTLAIQALEFAFLPRRAPGLRVFGRLSHPRLLVRLGFVLGRH